MTNKPEQLRLGSNQDYEGARVTLVRGVEALGMKLWHGSSSSRCNSQIDPWHWNSENYALACFRVIKRLSSNEAVPKVGMK
eukprot:875856-Pyramimonas_sp.AAC.1